MFIVALCILGFAGVFFRFFGINFINSYLAPATSINMGLLFVNVFGSLLMGIVFVLKTKSVGASEWAWLIVSVGFLGAFTTFSSYALEVMKALLSKQYLLAVNSFFLHNILALLFCFVGYWLASKAIA